MALFSPEKKPQSSKPEPKKIAPSPKKEIFEQQREWRTKELKYKVGSSPFRSGTPEAKLSLQQRREKFKETFEKHGSRLIKGELLAELRRLRKIESGHTRASGEERGEAKRLREHYQKQFGIKSKYSY